MSPDPNSKGQQVSSTCNQVFAREVNGQISEVSRDDFLRAAGNGEKVQIAVLETSIAHSARLQAEQRQADLEQQKFLASPEGKRQAAADAVRARKAAAEQAARQKAAEVARRQTEIAESLCDKAVEARFRPSSITYIGLYREEGNNLVYRYGIHEPGSGLDLYACYYSTTASKVLSVKYDEPD